MYCRECGTGINNGETICSNCGTSSREGVEYCNYCGNRTNEWMTNCPKCGAALINIVPVNKRKQRIEDYKKGIQYENTVMKICKVVIRVCVIAIIISILLFAFRKNPNEYENPHYFFHGDFDQRNFNTVPGYASDRQYDFWDKNIKTIGFIIVVVVVGGVTLSVRKKSRKRCEIYLKSIEEEEKCIAEHVEMK